VRTGDQVLLSRIKFLRGKVLVGTGSISDALNVLQDALKTARDARDSFGELMIMSRLGHATVQIDLDQGIDLLFDANKLFEARRKTYSPTAEGAVLDREFYQLKARIGLAEFDRGNLGEAEKWIKEAITGLDHLRTDYELPWALDFLGQVYTTMGRFEAAESSFLRALDIHKDEKGPLTTRAYNLAELGKLYLEWGRVPEAVQPLRKALQEIVDAWMVNVIPIVRNYYAELLMTPQSEVQDLDVAEQQILKALEESRKYNLRRSAIVALSLWGQLSLMQKDTEAALRFSKEAVQELEKKGAEPHVRVEEILFNHYLVLKAAGLEPEAQIYIQKALEVLQKKARSIPDKESRDAFLTRVPTSQRILTASGLSNNTNPAVNVAK
jgi:tetratricopeptide (TPR) repeat protein